MKEHRLMELASEKISPWSPNHITRVAYQKGIKQKSKLKAEMHSLTLDWALLTVVLLKS